MFNFIKKVLILVLVSAANLLVLSNASTKYMSLKNQECNLREEVVNNKYMALPYKIKGNKCSGSCNNITNPYSRMCIPDIVKNITVKMFDLMTLTNTTKLVELHKSCKYVCKLNQSDCSDKQRFNKDKM